jgi:hypothetical protein
MPILVPDVTADSDWAPFLSFSEAAGFGGVLSIPLLSKAGNLIGVALSLRRRALPKPES